MKYPHLYSITEARTVDKSELIDIEYDGRVNHTTDVLMHRLTTTNTPMVRYTRTIFRHMHSVALSNGLSIPPVVSQSVHH